MIIYVWFIPSLVSDFIKMMPLLVMYTELTNLLWKLSTDSSKQIQFFIYLHHLSWLSRVTTPLLSHANFIYIFYSISYENIIIVFSSFLSIYSFPFSPLYESSDSVFSALNFNFLILFPYFHFKNYYFLLHSLFPLIFKLFFINLFNKDFRKMYL